MKKLFTIFIAIALFFPLSVTAGKVYKWKDKNGRTHYSQFPHPDKSKKTEEIKTTEQSAEEKDSARRKLKELDAQRKKDTEEYYKNKKEEKKAEREAKKAEKRAENCEIARKNLSVLSNQANRRFSDGTGNTSYYSDEERAAKIKKQQDFIDKYCK